MQCLSFSLLAANIEAAETLLFDCGATAVTLEDAENVPQLEPKPGEILPWPESVLTAWFEPETPLAPIVEALQTQLPGLRVKQANVTEQDWQHQLHAGFKPLHFGERLSICPSWTTIPASDRVILNLDPGLAFGTGSHPTTAMCLTWLSDHLPANSRVIDYGCGSGILSLAALKLGAAHVLAIDYDPQAVQSTLNNAEKNQITPETITVEQPNEQCPLPQADVLVANILAGPLMTLAPRFRQALKPDGFLVLSGILETQATSVQAAYADWVTFEPLQQIEDWICLVGQPTRDKD